MKNNILSLFFLTFLAYGNAQSPCSYGILLNLTQDSCCFEVYILYSGPGCDSFPYDKVVLEPDPIQSIYFESISAATLNIDARLENNTAVFQDLANPPYFFQGSDSTAQFIGEICVSNPQDLNQAALTVHFVDEATMTTPPFTVPPVTIGIPDCVSPFPVPGGPVETAKIYGDSTDNIPTKIKAFGNGIYIAGIRTQQGLEYATFSKFDLSSGMLLWEQEFDFPSRIFDFEYVPNGPGNGDDEFLLVGRTEPFQIPGVGPQDNRSVLAKIDNWGNVVFVKRYQQSGRESFNRIIRNALLNGNVSFPYYILGSKNPDSPPGTSGATGEDVTVLYNINATGDINWAFQYTDFAGVELETHRGLFQAKGALYLTGNDVPFNNGMVFQVFSSGPVAGSWAGASTRFEDQWDIYGGVQLGNRVVYHGTDFGSGEAILIVEVNGASYYGLRFPGIREFRDIGLDGQGRIYVTAQADAPAPNNYWVICRVLDDGMQLSLDYAKYILDIGQDFSEAQIYVSPEYDRIFYADGRLAPSSDYDILWGAFDLDLNTTCAVPFDLSPISLNVMASGFEVQRDSLFDPPFLDGNLFDLDYGCIFTCDYSPCLVDVTPPLILCPPDITVSPGDEEDLSITGTPQVFDDCSTNLAPDPFSDMIAGQAPCPSTITRTWSVTDDAGLTSQCVQTITVACNPDTLRNCGEAVVTCFPGFVNNIYTQPIHPNLPVLGIVDVRDRTGAPLGSSGYWSDASSNIYHPAGAWTHSTMGLVFGLAIDGADNIYATTTTVYGCEDGVFQPFGPAGPGGIYRIDPADAVSQFITTGPFVPGGNQLPNTGSGLGNICYDPDHDQLFVTNFHDGMIYRIALPAGTIVDRFDPFTTGNGPSTDNPNFVELDERTWGIAYNKVDGRLYFSRWREDGDRRFDDRANEIWSVGIDPASGAFQSTNCSSGTCSGGELLELEMPFFDISGSGNLAYSCPVSDISFSEKGFMLIAERTMITDCGEARFRDPNDNFGPSDVAHRSRVLEFFRSTPLTWELTPGHGNAVPPFTLGNYANELKFVLANTGRNSSGGVDYGYESFTPPDTPMVCDDMVWASFDGFSLQPLPSGSNNIYGMKGMDATTGGNTSNSYLIDYDDNPSNSSKSMQGDVEVFRCAECPPSPPPCDSLMVMVSDSVVMDSSCCYTVDIKNQTNGTITRLCMELQTQDWILNTGQLGSGFTWDVVSSTTLCIENPDGIPMGDLQNVLQFCLTEVDAQAVSPQLVVFSWYEEECPLSCQDTLLTVCNPPLAQDTCVVIEDLSANCISDSAYAHCVNFTVTNTSAFEAYGLVLEDLPSGFSFGDCGCGGNSYGINGKEWAFDWFADPLDVGESRTICVSVISALPILNPVDVCFNASLEGLSACCSSPVDYCVTLEPCCDPCSEMTVSAEMLTGPGENCCYALDFQYDCDYAIFNKIEFDVLTDGVSFGNYFLGDGNWQVCGMPALDNVCIEPLLPGIGKGTYDDLFRFCLTDIDNSSEIPQELQVTFWTTGSDGQDSIACDTILFFDCQPPVEQPCAFITDEVIECVPDSMKYRITVNVENVSVPSFDAYFLGVLPFGEFDPNPIPLVPPLPSDGTTRTVSFCYEPAVFPDPDGELVLVYQLKDVLGDSCCNGNQMLFDTLALPFCDTCAFDMVPPSITCPPAVQLTNIDPCEEVVILDLEAPVAFDNCSDSVIIVCDAMTGDTVFCSGDGTPITQTVTCTATDQAGNSSSCSYDIIIQCSSDTIPPVLTCPADTQIVNIDQCIGGAFVDLVLPDAVDNCTDSLEVECDLQPGEFIPCGSNGAPFVRTVTCMATDEAGNTGTCSYDILVQCNCVNITGSSIGCTTDGNGFEYDFTITAENLTGGDCEGPVDVTSLTNSATVLPGYSVAWNGTSVEILGQLSATIPVPLSIDLQLGFSCICADSSIVNCEKVVTLTTPCCQTIGLEDQVFCSEEPVVNIPILGCEPDLVDQIFWYIAPGPCPASFGEPFQVTDADDCLDLVFPVSIFDPGPYCIKAEVIQNSAGGPCSVLSTNEASVFICTPRSCSVSPASQEFCYQGTPVLPDELVLSVSNADSICTFSIQWQELQSGGWVDVPGETGLSFQPPPIDFDGTPEDCFSDYSYRARITDVCGERFCTATIRLYNDDAPNGTLELDPPEFTPLCPGQDATLRYNPECAGDPSQWVWYARTASTGYAQIPGSGNRNPLFNTNKLFETTWYKIEKTNGVCPVDEVELQLEVKEPLVIDYFNASYSPQCTPTGVEMEVGFSPCCVCNYTVEWYKDGILLDATSHASTPAVYTFSTIDIEGNYYAIVKDECCSNQITESQVVSLIEPWEPLVALPCFFKSGESAELEGLLADLPVGTSCTYEWFGPDGSLISTDPIISVNQGGEYTFKVSCNDGCTKEKTVTLIECDLECEVVVSNTIITVGKFTVRIFPNPTNSILTLQSGSIPPTDLDIRIFDLQGKILKNRKWPKGHTEIQLDVTSFASGVYVIDVIDKDGNAHRELFLKS